MAIIGLCGFPGAGKSEVRKMLVRDFAFEDINSKSVLYGLAETATGIPAHKFSDPAYKDGEFEGLPMRDIVAHLGFAMEDLFGQDYLIRKAMANHRVKERTSKNFVIDSLRMNQTSLLKDEIDIVEIHNSRVKIPANSFDQFYRVDGAYILRNESDVFNLKVDVEKLLKVLGVTP